VKPHEPFGTATAEETTVAHQIAESEEFNEDPVDLYNKLLAKHGVESTGRIWSLACKLFDKKHGVS
jgi:hypothetical protein